MIVAILNAATLTVFAIAPPSPDGIWGKRSAFGKLCLELSGLALLDASAFAGGQIALVAVWALLAGSPRFLRWTSLGTALLSTALPLYHGDWRPGSWQFYLCWDILPHAMIACTALCLLRAAGTAICDIAEIQANPIRHFSHVAWFKITLAMAALSILWMAIMAPLYSSPLPRDGKNWRMFCE